MIDAANRDAIARLSDRLQQTTGDVLVVATVKTFKPEADIRSYAVKMFQNGGRGIGIKGKDNGLLVLLAVDDRQVWIEVGYGLEPYITDGFSGETSRQTMVPYFKQGDYGGGLLAGSQRLAARVAEGQGKALGEDVAPRQARERDATRASPSPGPSSCSCCSSSSAACFAAAGGGARGATTGAAGRAAWGRLAAGSAAASAAGRREDSAAGLAALAAAAAAAAAAAPSW